MSTDLLLALCKITRNPGGRTVTEPALGDDWRLIVRKVQEVIEPGTIFEPESPAQAAELLACGAARMLTASERALFDRTGTAPELESRASFSEGVGSGEIG